MVLILVLDLVLVLVLILVLLLLLLLLQLRQTILSQTDNMTSHINRVCVCVCLSVERCEVRREGYRNNA